MSGDVNAAAETIRRRTVCVYCGTRIPGKAEDAPKGERGRYLRWAARFTCLAHRDLPAVDPAYNGDC